MHIKQKNYPLAFFLAYLIPGLGHYYLGRKGLGLFFFIGVLSVYVIGIGLGGGILWDEMNILTVLAYTVKFFNGIAFLATLLCQLSCMTFVFNEIGTTYVLVSGALNLLIMIHIFDIIKTRKEVCQENL